MNDSPCNGWDHWYIQEDGQMVVLDVVRQRFRDKAESPMSENHIRDVVRATVLEILQDSVSAANIQQLVEKHQEKVHFVPIRYRVFGGILQGLNIKFGNFIEELLQNIVEIDGSVKAMPNWGRRSNSFSLHRQMP